MAKELKTEEIQEYLDILRQTIEEHDETCETCGNPDKPVGCELYSTISVEIRRMSIKLGLNW